jgi:hypothetical protein
MPHIRDVVRITGQHGSDLAELAANTTTDEATGAQWPIVTGQGLIDNSWLLWQAATNAAKQSGASEITLRDALIGGNNAPPVDISNDLDAVGYLVRMSLSETTSSLWCDLPRGHMNLDERSRAAYQVRQRLGQHLRNTLNLVCVVRAGRGVLSTWWIRKDWSTEPARKPRAAVAKRVKSDQPTKEPTPVAEPQPPQATQPAASAPASTPAAQPEGDMSAHPAVVELFKLVTQNQTLTTDNAALRRENARLRGEMADNSANAEIDSLRAQVTDLTGKLKKMDRLLKQINRINEQ